MCKQFLASMRVVRFSCWSVFHVTRVYLKQLASFQSLRPLALLCSALLPEEITWLSPPSTPAPADKAPLCNIPARCVSPLKPDIQHILVWKHSVAGRSTDNICYCLEAVKGDSTSWSRLEFTLWLALPITFAAVLLKWLLRRLPGWRSRLQSCCFVWLMEATHKWLC